MTSSSRLALPLEAGLSRTGFGSDRISGAFPPLSLRADLRWAGLNSDRERQSADQVRRAGVQSIDNGVVNVTPDRLKFRFTGAVERRSLRRNFTKWSPIMEIAQCRWREGTGWSPDLSGAGLSSPNLVFVFGARILLQDGNLVRDLRQHFEGAALIGCSTSGEIVGDEVIESSVIATAVTFDDTRLRTADAKITETKSSYQVGENWPAS